MSLQREPFTGSLWKIARRKTVLILIMRLLIIIILTGSAAAVKIAVRVVF